MQCIDCELFCGRVRWSREDFVEWVFKNKKSFVRWGLMLVGTKKGL